MIAATASTVPDLAPGLGILGILLAVFALLLSLALLLLPFFVWGIHSQIHRTNKLLVKLLESANRAEARALGYEVDDPFSGKKSR